MVDNDKKSNGLPWVSKNIIYIREPRRGISQARNAGLEYAIKKGYRWLAFMDDDGIASSNWLHALKIAQRKSGAQAVAGPQFYSFPPGLPEWRRQSTWGTGYCRELGECPVASTNNLLIDLEYVSEKNLHFNEILIGNGGGGDTLFTWQFTQSGGKIVWTNDAVVTETVPLERTTLKFAAKVAYRLGNHSVSVALMMGLPLDDYSRNALKHLIVGLKKLVASPFALVAGQGLSTLAEGVRHWSKALGIWDGLRGKRSNHYQITTGY